MTLKKNQHPLHRLPIYSLTVSWILNKINTDNNIMLFYIYLLINVFIENS